MACKLRLQYCAALGGLSESVSADVSLEGNMENEQTQTGAGMKICKDPDCKSKGIPRSIDDFQIHGPSGKPMGVCKECMARKISAKKKGKPRKKIAKKIKPPKEPSAENPDLPVNTLDDYSADSVLVIDFSKRRSLLEKIKIVADEQERTPEAQVLYCLKTFMTLDAAIYKKYVLQSSESCGEPDPG